MKFEIISDIDNIETIASGRGVRARHRLNRIYGFGKWRKLKGEASVQISNGAIRRVELHWYEAHGIGRRRIKIKRYLDD